MSNDGFGKAKYGKAKGASYISLKSNKDGSDCLIECRILPPIKSCQETGDWAKYYSVHYGFKGRDRNDTTKTRNRAFKCVLDRDWKTKIVRHECDACSDIARHRAKKMQAEATAKVEGRSDEEIKSILSSHKISHRLKKQLDALIENLIKKEGIDPLDPNEGLYLEFKRTGAKLDAIDSVSVARIVTRSESGKRTEEYKTAPLSPELRKKLVEVCPDLNELVLTISDDQISRLVQAVGDPDVIDKIFDASQPSARKEAPKETAREMTKEAPKAPKETAKAPEPDDEEAALMRQMDALRAKKARRSTMAPATMTAAVTPTT